MIETDRLTHVASFSKMGTCMDDVRACSAEPARRRPPRPSSSQFARYHRQIPEPIAARACGLYRCDDMPLCAPFN
ncbi:hypothetical protein [Burkholderia oklahomensis]|uniref:hypothetical protein n=1 Tax=Burkholderia oklahomensis TaxID=342113 RepID=UPI00016A9777|nr:hypothetical protein [Burkholderia oklahomensis]